MGNRRYAILNLTATSERGFDPTTAYRRAFTVAGGGTAELLMVGGGGGGGDADAGGGGGAGAVVLGTIALVPGNYDVIVGAGGLAAGQPGVPGTSDAGSYSPGHCGQHSRLRFPSGQIVTAVGGAGGNGIGGNFRVPSPLMVDWGLSFPLPAASCHSWNFGGGGAGTNAGIRAALTGSLPRYDSAPYNNVNVTEFKTSGHNYPDANGRRVGGGGGGAGGNAHANWGTGGFGRMVNWDGTEQWFGAGGGGAAYFSGVGSAPVRAAIAVATQNMVRQNGVGGGGAIHSARTPDSDPAYGPWVPTAGTPHTGSGGGGGCGHTNGFPSGAGIDNALWYNGGGSGIILLRYPQ